MTGKVIACIDDSQYAESVCDYAAWCVARMDAPLSLLHELDKDESSLAQNFSGSIGLGAQEALLQELAGLDQQRARIALEQGKLMLQAAAQRVEAKGVPHVETRQRHGELVDTLVELEPETRMFVVGKRGHRTASAHGHIGSHVESLIRALHKPVLIAQQSFAPPQRVMMAFDGSLTMRKGVHMMAASPLFKGLPCHLVMVGPDTDVARAQLAEASTILIKAGFETTTAIVAGEADVALTHYQQQQNIDLMIMGAYGHSRIRHLILGSTTTAMISKTTISLMVLR
ncbi:MAG: universal stress protein [Pseudohongiella sp.]|nr:universal stress protein [Pseudohongiella sp.]